MFGCAIVTFICSVFFVGGAVLPVLHTESTAFESARFPVANRLVLVSLASIVASEGLACQALGLHNGGVFMVATPRVLCDRVKWYQVVLSVGCSEVRGRVQAATVDTAVRQVMRSHSLTFADSASIWLLANASRAPVLRTGLRCRLPRVQSCGAVVREVAICVP